MADIKLLLVEDDGNLAFVEKNTLEDVIGGYEIITACNGKDGIKAWETFKPDVIISDIDMPVMNGIDMVKHIRELDGKTIIMFTTNLTSPSKLKEGYNVGVDEYIKKPFVPEELDCHVKALLKLKGGIERRNVSNCVKIGKHILDPEHTCLKDENGKICLKLGRQESKTLELLAKNKNAIIKRETIQNILWGSDEKDFYLARRLDVVITNLRKYLQIDPFVQIETTRGVGFSLIESI
nr:response regulator transcription factor [Prevotella sp.]